MGKGRLTVAVVAAVLVGSALTPATASLPEGDDLTDQAATFGIRAIADAGLLDPLGQYYGYDGIVRHEDRWVMSFRSSTCYRNEDVETCDPNTGTRQEIHDDAWLELAIEDERFVVTEAFGRFTDEQEDRLRAYTEPATIEQTHLEFPTVRLDRSTREEGWEIRAADLWAGPLPAPGVWSVCTPEIYDSGGAVLWTGRSIAFHTRKGEYFRANGLLYTGAMEVEGEPARADLVCGLWTQETWTLAAEPEINRDRKANTVRVEAPLVWEHEPLIALSSECRVDLLGRDDSLVATKTLRGFTSPWGGRQKKLTLVVDFDVRRPRAAESATVRCLARGQSFDE